METAVTIDPRNDDEIATLIQSVIHPWNTLKGKIIAGDMTVTTEISGEKSTSEIMPWSLTDVPLNLRDRYWRAS